MFASGNSYVYFWGSFCRSFWRKLARQVVPNALFCAWLAAIADRRAVENCVLPHLSTPWDDSRRFAAWLLLQFSMARNAPVGTYYIPGDDPVNGEWHTVNFAVDIDMKLFLIFSALGCARDALRLERFWVPALFGLLALCIRWTLAAPMESYYTVGRGCEGAAVAVLPGNRDAT